MPSLVVLGLLSALNVATFLTFGWDKYCAHRGRRRIPESALLTLAGLGGWPGAYLAMPVFRHKTQKQPFRRRLHGLAALWCLCVGGLLIWSASA